MHTGGVYFHCSLFHEAQAFRFVNGASSRLLKKAEGESINPKRTENFNLIIGSINLRIPQRVKV